MKIAVRWVGLGSIVVGFFGVGALVARLETSKRPVPPTPEEDPVIELTECDASSSNVVARWEHRFNECIAEHADGIDVRREGGHRVITTSTYSDFAVCAARNSCEMKRAPSGHSHTWEVTTYSGRDALDIRDIVVDCAFYERGGFEISGFDSVTIKTELGTDLHTCFVGRLRR